MKIMPPDGRHQSREPITTLIPTIDIYIRCFPDSWPRRTDFHTTPAGSVNVECLFSVRPSGLICNSRRSSPSKLNKLSFLHDNLDCIHCRPTVCLRYVTPRACECDRVWLGLYSDRPTCETVLHGICTHYLRNENCLDLLQDWLTLYNSLFYFLPYFFCVTNNDVFTLLCLFSITAEKA